MKYIIQIMLALSVISCGESTPEKKETKEERIAKSTTQEVAKHEDCTVYRTWMPGYNQIHWVRCKKEPKVVESNTTESCGKNCKRHVKTVTVEGDAP